MDVLTLTSPVTKEDFWFNFCQLKYQCNVAFPLDYITYKCGCGQDIALCKNGHYYLDGPASSLVEKLADDKIQLQNQHLHETKCGSTQALKISEAMGMPENLVVLLDESNMKDVAQVEIEDTIYEPILTIVSSSGAAVLVLYRKCHSEDDTYLNFFQHNFENHFNNADEEETETDQVEAEKPENLVSDDDSVSRNQDMLPRLTGGGRKLLQDFNYVCQWCSPEIIQQKNKGRFREIKNYRDHFRRYHSDVPMREFLSKVETNEPKWVCNICRRKISLVNQVRHQIICRPIVNYDTNTSSSGSDNDDLTNAQSQPSSSRRINNPVPSSSKTAGTQTVDSSESDSEPILPPRQMNKRQIHSDDSDHEVPETSTKYDQKKKKLVPSQIVPPQENPLNLSSSVPKGTLSSAQVAEETDVYDFDLELEEELLMSEVDPQVSTPDTDTDKNIEEVNLPTGSTVQENAQLSNEDVEKEKVYKWWQCEPKDRYKMKDRISLPIFEKDDSKEFLKTVDQNWKKHTMKKGELDLEMQRLDTNEEKLNQFLIFLWLLMAL